MKAFILAVMCAVSFLVFMPASIVSAQEEVTQIVPQECATGEPCEFNHLFGLASNVVKFLINAVIIIAALTITIAGLTMLSSAGNVSRYEQAKSIMMYAIIGLILALGALIIVNAIIRALGGTPLSGT